MLFWLFCAFLTWPLQVKGQRLLFLSPVLLLLLISHFKWASLGVSRCQRSLQACLKKVNKILNRLLLMQAEIYCKICNSITMEISLMTNRAVSYQLMSAQMLLLIRSVCCWLSQPPMSFFRVSYVDSLDSKTKTSTT